MSLTVAPAQAAVCGSSDQWATCNNGGHILYTNIWGGGAGPQSMFGYEVTSSSGGLDFRTKQILGLVQLSGT